MADNLYLSEEDTLDLLYGDDIGDFRHIAAERGVSSRWREHTTTVIQRREDGAMFGIEWQRGLTENCDHDYPEVSDRGTCKWRPMVSKEVVTTTYEYVR